MSPDRDWSPEFRRRLSCQEMSQTYDTVKSRFEDTGHRVELVLPFDCRTACERSTREALACIDP